jgi:CheY-like chemotaxis protein
MVKFLVIDDEPSLLDLIANVLRREDYVVRAVSDPLEGIRLCQGGEKFDLIITDVCMRPITGFELEGRLRLAGVGCPVLFMSGHPLLAAKISETVGHRFVIEKPFTAAQFRRAVTNVLRRYAVIQAVA